MTHGSFAKAMASLAAYCATQAQGALEEPFAPLGTEYGLSVMRSLRMRLDFIESVVRETAPSEPKKSSPDGLASTRAG